MRKYVPSYESVVAPSDLFTWKIEQRVQAHSVLDGDEHVVRDPHRGKSPRARQRALDMLRNELTAVSMSPDKLERLVDVTQVHVGMDGSCHVYKYYVTGAVNDSMLLWMQWCRVRQGCRYPSYDAQCMSMVVLPRDVPGLPAMAGPVDVASYLPLMRRMERDTLRHVVQESAQQDPVVWLSYRLKLHQPGVDKTRYYHSEELQPMVESEEEMLFPDHVEFVNVGNTETAVGVEVQVFDPFSAAVVWMQYAFGVASDEQTDRGSILRQAYQYDADHFIREVLWLDEHSGGKALQIMAAAGYEYDEDEYNAIYIMLTI